MYTNEQLESLRQIPIIEVIRQLGLNHLQKEGNRIKDQSMNVFISIKKNKYVDNLNDKKGFGAMTCSVLSSQKFPISYSPLCYPIKTSHINTYGYFMV